VKVIANKYEATEEFNVLGLIAFIFLAVLLQLDLVRIMSMAVAAFTRR
jgi:hypothetical protein